MRQIIGELTGHSKPVLFYQQDRNNINLLISAAEDEKIIIWDLEKNSIIFQKQCENGLPSAIAIKYPFYAISYKKDGKTRIENAIKKQNPIILARNLREVYFLEFYKENTIIIGSHDQYICIWDYNKEIIVKTIKVEPVQDLILNTYSPEQLVHISYAGIIKFINFVRNRVENSFMVRGAFEIQLSKDKYFKIVTSMGPPPKFVLLNNKNKILRIYFQKMPSSNLILSKQNNDIYFKKLNLLCQLNIRTWEEKILFNLTPDENIDILSQGELLITNLEKLIKIKV